MNTRGWSRSALALALSLFIFNLGVGPLAAETRGRAVAHAPGSAADGEELFRGIFFASGPAADVMGDVWSAPEAQKTIAAMHAPEAVAIQNRVVDALRADNSLYFERFSNEMRSGDQIRVEAAVREAGTRLKTLATDSVRKGNTHLGSASGTCFELVSVAAVAVAVVVGVVVYFEFWIGNKDANGTPLQRDVLIDKMTTRLAVR